ncbi:hypothetical protein DO021_19540 [Desulfobacter hydrogenophilus]|uniref:AntA/AntB antirepressor domain-containing protein n=2 Tax=Desulfobacter hydrogenophilus TaxID=2291 RepID=A0A328FBE6_9BACT|nr:hypothetical protein [Desulfobacter hydrogenophilus]QBH15629.1 hypothetical protein EYB58_16140 [Desulfobacter hydrogenophilus]RAM00347.1 hypothetical protein DO021_19540 [Desulfobacter hydrogenophilus]
MGGTIQIFVNEEGERSVDARELYQFLEVGKDFSTWIKGRIDKYGFALNADYIITYDSPKPASNGVYPRFGENPQGSEVEPDLGGRPSVNYHLTLDMAKELAMVERNDKGREARQYFIECEKIARQTTRPFDVTEYVNRVYQLGLETGKDQVKKEITTSLKGLSDQRFLLLRRASGYKAMGLTNREVGKLMDTHKDTIRKAVKQSRDIGVFGAPESDGQMTLFSGEVSHG